MEGVDENEPAMDPRKRKAGDDEVSATPQSIGKA